MGSYHCDLTPMPAAETVVGAHVDEARSSTSRQRTSRCICTGARWPPNCACETWIRRRPSGPRQARAPTWPPTCSGKGHEPVQRGLRGARPAALKNEGERQENHYADQSSSNAGDRESSESGAAGLAVGSDLNGLGRGGFDCVRLASLGRMLCSQAVRWKVASRLVGFTHQ